jgi:hypothetical protein
MNSLPRTQEMARCRRADAATVIEATACVSGRRRLYLSPELELHEALIGDAQIHGADTPCVCRTQSPVQTTASLKPTAWFTVTRPHEREQSVVTSSPQPEV